MAGVGLLSSTHGIQPQLGGSSDTPTGAEPPILLAEVISCISLLPEDFTDSFLHLLTTFLFTPLTLGYSSVCLDCELSGGWV